MANPPGGTKRPYSTITGGEQWPPAEKNPRMCAALLPMAFTSIDSRPIYEVELVVSNLWDKGFLHISDAGELSFSLELSAFLNPERLEKLLCLTQWQEKTTVTTVAISHYHHLGREVPAILLSCLPDLSLSCLKKCHEDFATISYYVGDDQVSANKEILLFANPNFDSVAFRLADIPPQTFRNCLRLTTGELPCFARESHTFELLQLARAVNDLELLGSQERIVDFYDHTLATYLMEYREAICQLEGFVEWLNSLTKLLYPHFQAGKLQRCRSLLADEFSPLFYQQVAAKSRHMSEENPTLKEIAVFARLERYLTLLKDDTSKKLNSYFTQILKTYVRKRLFSGENLAEDPHFLPLFDTPFVQARLSQFLETTRGISYKQLSGALICNMLTLLEHVRAQVDGVEELIRLDLQLIDLLQFNLRDGDLDKAISLCEDLSSRTGVTQPPFILIVRKANPQRAMELCRHAMEVTRSREVLEDLRIILAYLVFNDEQNLDGAIELLQGRYDPVARHLLAYLYAQKNPRDGATLKELVKAHKAGEDFFAYFTSWKLDQKVPLHERVGNISFTMLATLGSEILIQMPPEWQFKVFPTPEIYDLFITRSQQI